MVKSYFILKLDGKEVDPTKIGSIAFNDQAGTKSDRVTVSAAPDFPRPKPNTKLELIFYGDEEMNCGLFFVQTVTRSNNKNLTFTATGVEFNDKQKKKRSQHYKDTKLSTIVNIVAERLGHKVKFMTKDLSIKSLHQTDETDLNFLDRISKDYDVLFSIKDDFVFFVNRTHESLPNYKVDISKCSSSSLKRSSKTYYKSCECSWHELKGAKKVTVTVGEGEPVLKIKGTYKDHTEARLKAKAKLEQSRRGLVSGSLSTLGFKVYAGTRLEILETYKDEDDGIFYVETCNHQWSRSTGWTVDVEFQN